MLAHIVNLPPTSATVRALQGERAFWTWDTELAASTFDAIQRLTHYFLVANGASPSEPKPFPRPDHATTSHDGTDIAGFRAFLGE